MRRDDAWRVAFAALVLVSLYFLLTPSPPAAPAVPDAGQFLARKIGHVAIFAALGFSLRRAWRAPPAWALWLGLVAYAAFTELAQGFVPTRHAAATDVLIDAAGALLVFLRSREATR